MLEFMESLNDLKLDDTGESGLTKGSVENNYEKETRNAGRTKQDCDTKM